MDQDPRPQPDILDRLSRAVYPSFAALAALQLDLFTSLKDGPLTAGQIAGALDVKTGKLTPLLYSLVATELLCLEGDRFSNSPEADRYLVSTRPSYVGGSHKLLHRLWAAALGTAESIRSGLPQDRHDPSKVSPEELEAFLGCLHEESVETGRDLAQKHSFESCKKLLDVGGGTGGLAIGVTEACPGLQATVVDLPAVAPIAKRFIQNAGSSNRVRVEACDVVHQAPAGAFDVAVLKAILQTLSPDEAQKVICHVSRAITPGGTILILGAGILDNDRISPKHAAAFNIVFLNLYDEGQAYTEQEYRAWLSEAGFVRCERMILADGSSLIKAKKPI